MYCTWKEKKSTTIDPKKNNLLFLHVLSLSLSVSVLILCSFKRAFPFPMSLSLSRSPPPLAILSVLSVPNFQIASILHTEGKKTAG